MGTCTYLNVLEGRRDSSMDRASSLHYLLPLQHTLYMYICMYCSVSVTLVNGSFINFVIAQAHPLLHHELHLPLLGREIFHRSLQSAVEGDSHQRGIMTILTQDDPAEGERLLCLSNLHVIAVPMACGP